MNKRKIREKCSYSLCRNFRPKRETILSMAPEWDYGGYSEKTGWYGSIECSECGRRVEYVGAKCEKKADVERKLRELWHVANSDEHAERLRGEGDAE